ncbi:F-box/kelch-repeat protein [Acorus calamus]|uniref:F-box/kelch-repeat protein n=1 Tax=Acorus calamus TaxID=4465 RepID=A0AAV9EZ80_ACOCL|nr:F-box/kelch-repeat protein [Acorus calamus]
MSLREGEHQAIIPGLPDDLAIQCLARISHGYHGVLECVSKRWRDVMRSSAYSHIKAANGWSGDWWFVLTERQHDGQWNAYDPEANNWHHLPRFHTDEPPGDHLGFSCVSVSKKFLVIGGFYESPLSPIFPELKTFVMNDVWLFDPFKKQWSRRASMKMPRSEFACVVISGKVYVAGGYNSSEPGGITNAEIYDPVTDRWEDLPSMPFPQMECSGVSYQGRFHVIGGKVNRDSPNTYDVFDPNKGVWHTVEYTWPFSRMMWFSIAVMKERIYVITEWDADTIRARNTQTEEWCTVVVLPPIVLADHSRPLETFGYGFVGSRGKLYVIGGKALKYLSDDREFEITKLNMVRFCNPTVLPLEWKEAKPMRGAGGNVRGCAVLEE